MGDVGIDKWWSIMQDHKLNGHHIIEPGDTFDRKTVNEDELFLNMRRIRFWERHHRVPTTRELV
jgi:hypothetical protein